MIVEPKCKIHAVQFYFVAYKLLRIRTLHLQLLKFNSRYSSFLCYLQLRRKIMLVWVGLVVVTLLYPPMGWLRPHRHSERPGNRGGLREWMFYDRRVWCAPFTTPTRNFDAWEEHAMREWRNFHLLPPEFAPLVVLFSLQHSSYLACLGALSMTDWNNIIWVDTSS